MFARERDLADKQGRLSRRRSARNVRSCRQSPDIQKTSIAFKLKPNPVQSRLQVSGVSLKSCEVAEDDSTWSKLAQRGTTLWDDLEEPGFTVPTSSHCYPLFSPGVREEQPTTLKPPFACFGLPKTDSPVTRLGMLLLSPGNSGAPAGKRRCKKDGKSWELRRTKAAYITVCQFDNA